VPHKVRHAGIYACKEEDPTGIPPVGSFIMSADYFLPTTF